MFAILIKIFFSNCSDVTNFDNHVEAFTRGGNLKFGYSDKVKPSDRPGVTMHPAQPDQ